MSDKEMTPGQLCYSSQGEAARFITFAGGEFIVRTITEFDNEGEYVEAEGHVEAWPVIYTTPPVEKRHAEIARLDDLIAGKRAELREVEKQHRAAIAEADARMARIQQHEMLEDLDRFLAGEFTHYVTESEYSPTVKVIPVSETLDEYRSMSGYGMLTLFPCREGGKVRFKVERYLRKSGSSESLWVIPCCGFDVAREKAAAILRKKLTACAGLTPEKMASNLGGLTKLRESCEEFDVEIPLEILETAKAAALLQLSKRIAGQQQEISRLMSLEAEIVSSWAGKK